MTMKKILLTLMLTLITLWVCAQSQIKKVYDETINPIEQIDKALAQAKRQSDVKFVICQVGGNWCPWCLRFADFISNDSDIMKVVNDNFIYLHVNYNPRKGNNAQAEKLMKRLGNPQRFGFPVFVVLNDKGEVIHIQDSSFLEDGKGYDKEKVLRLFRNWTPKAVN